MPEILIHYASFGCSVIMLFFGILHLSYRKKEMLNYVSASLFISIGYLILYIWSFFTATILHVPWLLYSDLAVTFFIAPCVYFFVSEITGKSVTVTSGALLHFMPALVCMAFFIEYVTVNPSIIAYYKTHRAAYPNYNLNAVITALSIMADTWLALYFVMTLKNMAILLKKGNFRYVKELRTLLVMILVMTLSCSLLFIAHILKNDILMIAFIFLACFLSILYYIYSIRHPEFGHRVIKAARKIRYENTLPGHIDPHLVLTRLTELMEDDKIYRDDELSLARVSSMLKITSHQLSQIINKKTKMNFRGFINSYRVEEGKRLLIEKPDMSILEVAFTVGFSSKPSFNNFFLRQTGLTPREYRKNNKNVTIYK